MKASSMVFVVFIVVGLGLIVIPWLPASKPMPAPASFDGSHAAYRELVKVAKEIDVACGEGRLAEVKSRVTESFLKDIAARLENAGKGLNGATLKGQHLVGELDASMLVAAGAQSDRAALVFRRDRYDREGGRFLSCVVFGWDGERWRLHQTGFRRLPDRATPQPATAGKGKAGAAAATGSGKGVPAAAKAAAFRSAASDYLHELLSASGG